MSFTGRVNRKARCDRNHAIYRITSKITGEEYVGLTFVRPPTAKEHTRSKMPMISVMSRFKSHCYRANNGSTDLFHQKIRELGQDNFHVSIIEIIRGKEEAHKREVEIIKSIKPKLNTANKWGDTC